VSSLSFELAIDMHHNIHPQNPDPITHPFPLLPLPSRHDVLSMWFE
jgi:hypothetical protein